MEEKRHTEFKEAMENSKDKEALEKSMGTCGGGNLVDEEEIAKSFRKLINLLNEDEAKEVNKLLLKVQSRLLKEEE